MDITAYWLNHKKRDAGEGKVYYLYPYTRCEKDDTPTLFIAGKHYARIAVSEEEWRRLRKLDDKEYNSERRAHNKRWTADIPRLQNEDGEEIDFWSDRAEDKRTHYIEDDICEEMDRRAAVSCLPPLERRIYRADREGYTQSEIAREWSSSIRPPFPASWTKSTSVWTSFGCTTASEAERACLRESAGKVSCGTAL